MRTEKVLITETKYAVGSSSSNARSRGKFEDTISEAWDAVPYYDKLDFGDDLDVYKFETVETITKLNPPYDQ